PGFRKWLRGRFWSEADEAHYGLRLEDGWQDAASHSTGRPLVVLVHGYNSTPERNAAVMAPIRAAGFPCGAYSYPNDWDLTDASERMSRQLKEFAATHPNQKIALVTHSMGGLVARACVENPALDPGDVVQLIMIAPPSQGTLLANFAVGTDVWEHWLGRTTGG